MHESVKLKFVEDTDDETIRARMREIEPVGEEYVYFLNILMERTEKRIRRRMARESGKIS
ncbi:MAG TPA: hypothetical protein VI957_01955 [Candidatus Paceibacterota bacterium]